MVKIRDSTSLTLLKTDAAVILFPITLSLVQNWNHHSVLPNSWWREARKPDY